MTVAELLDALRRHPGHLDVAVCVVGQEGITYEPATAAITAIVDAGDRVWLTGLETSDTAPATTMIRCHCGIEHDIDINGTVCELPARTGH